jgi:predicted acetyltransferase
MVQIHKKFTDTQVRELIERYMAKKIGRKYVQEILGIKKTRFFALVKQIKEEPETSLFQALTAFLLNKSLRRQ